MVADYIKAMLLASHRGLRVNADPGTTIDVVNLSLWQWFRAAMPYPLDSYYPETNACITELRTALNTAAYFAR